jgi:hypothetical protein
MFVTIRTIRGPQAPFHNTSVYFNFAIFVRRMNPIQLLTFALLTANISFQAQCPVIQQQQQPAPLDCPNGTATLVVQVMGTGSGSYTYTWSAPPGAGVTGVNTPTLVTTAPGSYTIAVTNTLSSCTSTSVYQVTGAGLIPKFTAVSLHTAPMTVQFENQSFSTQGSGAAITTTWNFGDGQTAVTSMPSQTVSCTYNVAGTYTVFIQIQKSSCNAFYQSVVSPGMPGQPFVGLSEHLFANPVQPVYFDFQGKETDFLQNCLLIEQRGARTRKMICIR